MCEALLELFKEEIKEEVNARVKNELNKREQDGIEIGKQQGISLGISQGIFALIHTCKDLCVSREITFEKLKAAFDLSDDDTENYLAKYW